LHCVKGERLEMGQKSIPIGLRIGINRTYDSRWFAEKKEYTSFLIDDLKIRKFLTKRLKGGGVSKVVIERPHRSPRLTIYTSRPGVIIGKKGSGIELLKTDLRKNFGEDVSFNIVEIRRPDLYAQLVADDIAQQMVKRVSYKRASKRAMQSSLRMGAKGIKVICSGRLGGAEIARREWMREGSVPLHTFRADIDYGASVAHTAYGACGVKVLIYRGEVLDKDLLSRERQLGEVVS
jgi:small subunit ribosomal protein S3